MLSLHNLLLWVFLASTGIFFAKMAPLELSLLYNGMFACWVFSWIAPLVEGYYDTIAEYWDFFTRGPPPCEPDTRAPQVPAAGKRGKARKGSKGSNSSAASSPPALLSPTAGLFSSSTPYVSREASSGEKSLQTPEAEAHLGWMTRRANNGAFGWVPSDADSVEETTPPAANNPPVSTAPRMPIRSWSRRVPARLEPALEEIESVRPVSRSRPGLISATSVEADVLPTVSKEAPKPAVAPRRRLVESHTDSTPRSSTPVGAGGLLPVVPRSPKPAAVPRRPVVDVPERRPEPAVAPRCSLVDVSARPAGHQRVPIVSTPVEAPVLPVVSRAPNPVAPRRSLEGVPSTVPGVGNEGGPVNQVSGLRSRAPSEHVPVAVAPSIQSCLEAYEVDVQKASLSKTAASDVVAAERRLRLQVHAISHPEIAFVADAWYQSCSQDREARALSLVNVPGFDEVQYEVDRSRHYAMMEARPCQAHPLAFVYQAFSQSCQQAAQASYTALVNAPAYEERPGPTLPYRWTPYADVLATLPTREVRREPETVEPDYSAPSHFQAPSTTASETPALPPPPQAPAAPFNSAAPADGTVPAPDSAPSSSSFPTLAFGQGPAGLEQSGTATTGTSTSGPATTFNFLPIGAGRMRSTGVCSSSRRPGASARHPRATTTAATGSATAARAGAPNVFNAQDLALPREELLALDIDHWKMSSQTLYDWDDPTMGAGLNVNGDESVNTSVQAMAQRYDATFARRFLRAFLVLRLQLQHAEAKSVGCNAVNKTLARHMGEVMMAAANDFKALETVTNGAFSKAPGTEFKAWKEAMRLVDAVKDAQEEGFQTTLWAVMSSASWWERNIGGRVDDLTKVLRRC